VLQLSFAHVTVHNALKWLQLGTCDIVVEVAYESANGLVDIILNVFYQAEFRAIDVWTNFSEAHTFLPRGAVLVRDMLWHCVCPCAFHKSEFIKTVKHASRKQRCTIAHAGLWFYDAKNIYVELDILEPLCNIR